MAASKSSVTEPKSQGSRPCPSKLLSSPCPPPPPCRPSKGASSPAHSWPLPGRHISSFRLMWLDWASPGWYPNFKAWDLATSGNQGMDILRRGCSTYYRWAVFIDTFRKSPLTTKGSVAHNSHCQGGILEIGGRQDWSASGFSSGPKSGLKERQRDNWWLCGQLLHCIAVPSPSQSHGFDGIQIYQDKPAPERPVYAKEAYKRSIYTSEI